MACLFHRLVLSVIYLSHLIQVLTFLHLEFKSTENIELDTGFWNKLQDISTFELPPHPNEVEGTKIFKNKKGFYDVCSRENFRVYAGPLKHSIPCIGYVIQENNLPGKLDVAILKSKGVPSGPLYGKIKSGQSIRLDNGEVISPEDCVGPERPGRKIVILGDTYCSDGVLDLAQNADVLVHESTNENEDEEKSIQHGHSTAGKIMTS